MLNKESHSLVQYLKLRLEDTCLADGAAQCAALRNRSDAAAPALNGVQSDLSAFLR